MTWKTVDIPKNLPGHQLKPDYKEAHHKNQTFKYKLNSMTMDEPGKFDAAALGDSWDWSHDMVQGTKTVHPTHDERKAAKEALRNTYRPANEPAWLKHDRQILSVDAYTTETLKESTESHRVRPCSIRFYLEDGTTEISEPKIQNSGLTIAALGECIVNRHIISKDCGNRFEPKDMKMGTSVFIYKREYHITGMDNWTKNYLQSEGLEVGEPQSVPQDDWHAAKQAKQKHDALPLPESVMHDKMHRAAMNNAMNPNGLLKKFLENDGKVLRFYCYWDDHTRYGVRSYYTFHYFLADDTVEVLESYSRNCGRAPHPVFSKRGPLYKNVISSCTPGMVDPNDLIPVTYDDLLVGTIVPVRGRSFYVYSCDQATRNWYGQRGVEQGHEELEKAVIYKPTLAPPPMTGFGTPEDSLGSVRCLMPKPPRQDMVKLMTNSDVICRYEAVLHNAKEEDQNRRFIIAFYPSDDTCAVFEMKIRNSGNCEGKFAEKCRRTNPMTQKCFQAEDFFVGAVITIQCFEFHIIRADEYTLKHMESRPATYPLSDVNLIGERLAPAKETLKEAIGDNENVSPDLVAEVAAHCGVELFDQELITLLRHQCHVGKSESGSVVCVANLNEVIEGAAATAQ